MTVDVGGLNSTSSSSASLADKAKVEMTVESSNEDYDSKRDEKQITKDVESESGRSAMTTPPSMSAAPAATSAPTPASARPKFMITDILRNDTSPPVAYPPAPLLAVPQLHHQHQHQHQFYPFNLFGFNPAMVPPHLLFGPAGHLVAPAGSAAAGSEASSPRDLSLKRSAAAAQLGQHPEDDDEDEFVDPDGSDHERDSPIGKADLMLSDDDSDMCELYSIRKLLVSIRPFRCRVVQLERDVVDCA